MPSSQALHYFSSSCWPQSLLRPPSQPSLETSLRCGMTRTHHSLCPPKNTSPHLTFQAALPPTPPGRSLTFLRILLSSYRKISSQGRTNWSRVRRIEPAKDFTKYDQNYDFIHIISLKSQHLYIYIYIYRYCSMWIGQRIGLNVELFASGIEPSYSYEPKPHITFKSYNLNHQANTTITFWRLMGVCDFWKGKFKIDSPHT